MLFPFVETKVSAGSEETNVTKPLPLGNGRERGVEAEHVEAWCSIDKRVMCNGEGS